MATETECMPHEVTEERCRSESNADLLANLTREAQLLREKLEEEKSKLHDAELNELAQRIEPLPALVLRCRRILRGHQAKVLCMDWSKDGQHVVSSSQDGRIIVWDAFTTNKLHAILTANSWAMTCAYSPSQNLIACCGLDNKCNIYNLMLREEMVDRCQEVADHGSHVTCCSFTRSDHQLITGSADSTCALWDIETNNLIQDFRGHRSDVMCLCYSHLDSSSQFVSGGCDNSIRVWDMRNGQCVQKFDNHTADINAVRYFPNGDAIGSASDDSTCRLFDLRADRELSVYKKESILFGASSLDFSLSGRVMLSGYNDYTVHVWDTLKASHCGTLFGHENRISCLQVSPDGTAVSTGSWDSTLRVWA